MQPISESANLLILLLLNVTTYLHWCVLIYSIFIATQKQRQTSQWWCCNHTLAYSQHHFLCGRAFVFSSINTLQKLHFVLQLTLEMVRALENDMAVQNVNQTLVIFTSSRKTAANSSLSLSLIYTVYITCLYLRISLYAYIFISLPFYRLLHYHNSIYVYVHYLSTSCSYLSNQFSLCRYIYYITAQPVWLQFIHFITSVHQSTTTFYILYQI